MSEFINDPCCYPLGDAEIIECINELDGLAEFVFGPAQFSSAISQTKEITYSDYRHFSLVRRINYTQTPPLINIDLAFFSPEHIPDAIKITGEGDELSIRIQGSIIDMSASVNEKELVLHKNIGCLTVSSSGEIDITIYHDNGEDYEEPSDNPSDPTIQDMLAVLTVLAHEKHTISE